MSEELEKLRLECERAWSEVDEVARERDLLRAKREADAVLMRQALDFLDRMDNSGLPMRSHERTTIAALRERLGDKHE